MKLLNTQYTDNKYNNFFATWPFELSNFQKWAIHGTIENKNILITAHTGSGKTLPSEFAIQHFVSQGKKVIYTAPIKALSNQKFKDFTEKFPDISVGILTGDIKFNPEADVLIMTTEILRNTLYQKQMIQTKTINENQVELLFEMDFNNELACVVFDEVHYINDADRGKVWEETIILLPKTTQMILLSATIDKSNIFAKWVEDQTQRETWLCPTNKRVVPLSHNAFITLPKSIYEALPLKIKNLFEENNFYEEAISLKTQNSGLDDAKFHKIRKIINHFQLNNIRTSDKFIINQITLFLKEKKIIPAIVFVFSRKQTENLASKIQWSFFEENSKKPSIVKKECTKIIMKLPNWKEYTTLPLFDKIVKLLQKGIAFHHAGLPQIFREMIEHLFDKGFVKILFATETFAVGINMPTKSVVFTSMKKFDGSSERFLLSHEYTQMAGRAGRRGLDTKGYVFHLINFYERNNKLPSVTELNQILCGKPQTLESKFSVDFNIILNIIATNPNATIEDIKNYIDKSMMKNEIKGQIEFHKNNFIKSKSSFDDFQQSCSFESPTDFLEEYIIFNENKRLQHPKNIKKMNKKFEKMKSTFPNLIDELNKFNELFNKKRSLDKLNNKIKHLKNYTIDTINIIIELLQKYKLITCCNPFIISQKGLIASSIQEIHSLALADILETKKLNLHSAQEIASILSIFTNVNVSKENNVNFIKHINCSDKIKNTLEFIQNKYNFYYDEELNYKIKSSYNYNIHWNMVEIVFNWCNANNESECQRVYQEALYYNISLGEFIKAILKINAITLEFQKICLISENLKLLEIIKKIPTFTLKSIATNQSLYV